MNLLSDAEYRQLTDIQKADYWRGRYYEVAAECDQYRAESRYLRFYLNKARQATNVGLDNDPDVDNLPQ